MSRPQPIYWVCKWCLAANGDYLQTCAVCHEPRQPGANGPSARPDAATVSLPGQTPPARAGAARATRDRTPKSENKTEAEWCDILRRRHTGLRVVPHGLRISAPNGDTYTVDAVVWAPDGSWMECWEVKGGYRGPGWEQGMERHKRFREQYGALRLHLAEKRADGWYVDGNRCKLEALGQSRPGSRTPEG